jgi:hypothetical protein
MVKNDFIVWFPFKFQILGSTKCEIAAPTKSIGRVRKIYKEGCYVDSKSQVFCG